MWQVIIILLCLITNGIIAGTECAFVSVSKQRLKKLADGGDKKAARLYQLRKNPERTLSILQLGITFIGVIGAAFGGVQVNAWASPFLESRWGLGPNVSEVLAILVFVVPYTFLSVVVSELLPKSLALKNPRWFLARLNGIFRILAQIFLPLALVLEKLTKFFAHFFAPWFQKEKEEGGELILVGKGIRPYMFRLASMGKMRVKNAMTPWERVDTLDLQADVEQVKKVVLETGHTRIPLVKEGKPVGILLAKEFLQFYLQNRGGQWQKLKRDWIQLGEEDSLVHALRKMQGEGTQQSLVIRGQEPVGIVTIEDILEEVVGEIRDEDDPIRG